MIAKHIFTRRAFAVWLVMAYSGAWLSLLGLAGFNLAPAQALTMADAGVMYLAMLVGPRRAGPITAAVLDGRAILGELPASRMANWRQLHWHAQPTQPVIAETAFAA